MDAGLWDLNARLAADCAMGEQGGSTKARWRLWVERQTDGMESWKRGNRDKVETRVRRRAEAHPSVVTEGAARKNRSTYMLIVPRL